MKTLIVGDRPLLNQRIGNLLEKNGFEVQEASPEDQIIELLALEPFDLLLLVGLETGAVSPDLIPAIRDVRPSTYIYLLSGDGSLSQLIAQMQPAMGKKIGVNDLPTLLREEVGRADIEREHFRMEWLTYTEQLLDLIITGTTMRDAIKKAVDRLHEILLCSGTGVVLVLQQGRPADAIATAGDDSFVRKLAREPNVIYEWLSENQSPLLLRRGRATIPGIQREVVKYGLGPSIFVPIVTADGFLGALTAVRDPDGAPFTDSAFALARVVTKALVLRLETHEDMASDELREMVQHERQGRETLEDAVTEAQDAVRRLAREVSGIIDTRKGHRPDRSETVAKLAVALAEQLKMDSTHLPEAVYLRDIGVLVSPDMMMPGGQPVSPGLEARPAESAQLGFEVLSRMRLPSTCLEVVHHIHENYDGSGVPDGIKGEDIPLSARVVRVVDNYFNMTVSGNGGPPAPSPVALGNLLREAGRLYDPLVVDTFTKLIRAQGVTPEQETLSLIAHELRTPLTFLVGFSELLAARQDLPAQAKEMAAELHDQTEQMVVLTERLLEISRLQSGRVSLTRQWVDLKALIDEQVAKHSSVAAGHTIRVQAPAYAVRLRADPTRLVQATSNLISNAIKYSPQGGEVTVKLEEGVDDVVISVSDQGLGIPKDTLGRLFQPFYRVQQAETRQIEGLGLGLALTKSIIDAHGGRIWVESEPGLGSTFSFSIPKQEAGYEQAVGAGSATE